jgi:omega-amidase
MSLARIIALQMDIAWEDRAANHAKVLSLLEKVKLDGGELIILPEMFASGFSMNVSAIADDAGETRTFLQDLAKRHRIHIVAGVASRSESGRGRNEALVIDRAGKVIATYCKLHPYSIGGEADHYEPGTELAFSDWAGLSVCPVICYDLRFPEVFRKATSKGAELFTVIASWPDKREEHWVTLLRARAIENQSYVVGVNRCGNDPSHRYPGRSMVIDPKGNVIADGGASETVVDVMIDPSLVKTWRSEFPILKDVRSDLLRR